MKYGNNGLTSNIHTTNSWQKSTVDDNSWRQVPGRFDRSYNDRSTGYQGQSGGGGAGGMYGASRPTQDRYSGPVSRY